MSVMMFIPKPADDIGRKCNAPVLNEMAFNKIVLPVAEQVGADMVCRFGIGVDVESSDVPQLERELRDVIENLPQTDAVKEYVEPRLLNLIVELRRVFEIKPKARVYIG
jgi:hypothetical protein